MEILVGVNYNSVYFVRNSELSDFLEDVMLKNYIKIALRNMFRSKLYSFINLTGLAIGLAACLMIWLWVQDELSFDQFHQNADRIYRVERKVDFRDIHGQAPITSPPYGPALVSDYPEIENYVRMHRQEISFKDHQNVFYKQELIFADNSIFQIFDFPLERGDPKTALMQPNTMVLTHESALKYFGIEDVIGKSITVDCGDPWSIFRSRESWMKSLLIPISGSMFWLPFLLIRLSKWAFGSTTIFTRTSF